jgi:hypothetical protein
VELEHLVQQEHSDPSQLLELAAEVDLPCPCLSKVEAEELLQSSPLLLEPEEPRQSERAVPCAAVGAAASPQLRGKARRLLLAQMLLVAPLDGDSQLEPLQYESVVAAAKLQLWRHGLDWQYFVGRHLQQWQRDPRPTQAVEILR